MHHVMFDIDGTLVESTGFDYSCFIRAVKTVLEIDIDHDLSNYEHVTHTGIVNALLDSQIPNPERLELTAAVESQFVSNIEQYISQHRIKAIEGAAAFIETLRSEHNVSISIATGSWYEPAMMKLDAAGIEVSDLPMASSNDHYDRSTIMQMARARSVADEAATCTYFGDGAWDKAACQKLGYNFVLVGNATEHEQHIDNFTQIETALRYLDLLPHSSARVQPDGLTLPSEHC